MSKQWNCHACTLENADTALRCVVCLAKRRGIGGNKQSSGARSPVVVDLLSASSSATRSDEGALVASMESARSRKRKRAQEQQPREAAVMPRDRGAKNPEKDDFGKNSTHQGTEKNEAKCYLRDNDEVVDFGRRASGKGVVRSRVDPGSRTVEKSISDVTASWMKDAVELSSSDDDDSAFHTGAKSAVRRSHHPRLTGRTKKIQPASSVGPSRSRKDGKKQGNKERSAGGNRTSVDSSQSGKTQQTTLFGKIVRDIQEQDLSTCSTSTRVYTDDKSEGDYASSSAGKVDTSNAMTTPSVSKASVVPSVQSLPEGSFSGERLKSLRAKSERIMRETFRISSLRNLQPQAVAGALSGQSQIVVMATGGGKSLCYQLPAAVLPGVTVVVAPLIALMVDQVSALNARGVPAALVSSANSERENAEVLQRLVGRRNGAAQKKGQGQTRAGPLKPIKLVYCTPELIETTRFRAVLTELHQRGQLALFAIDEAHCLSTWGHDFRPAYRKLNWVRAKMPTVPCMACTATATPKVIQDIKDNLNMTEAPCHMSTFNRVNISYEVRYKDNIDAANPRGAIGNLVEVVRRNHEDARSRGEKCSGIVYVHKRDDTQMLAQRISREAGVKAAPYHGGLKDLQRSDVQKKWTDGLIDVAVATVAFGMGIDLPHVRYVVHWSMAKTVEGFYQESGRGGRDGKPAVSILYYSKDDASRFAFIIKKSMEKKSSRQHTSKASAADDRGLAALQGMVDYCIQPGCRRKYLLKHFGEAIEPKVVCKSTCDHCKNPAKVESSINLAAVSRDVMKMSARQKSSGMLSQDWDGQWNRPHGGEEENESEIEQAWERDEGDLRINHSDGGEPYNNAKSRDQPSAGFVTAKNILEKFEMKEMEEGRAGGFINFRAKEVPKMTEVRVPEHMRTNMPDPLQAMAKKPADDRKSSKEIASDVDRMKAELEALRAEKAARQAKLKERKASKNGPSAPKFAAPPPLSFGSGKGKNRRKRIR